MISDSDRKLRTFLLNTSIEVKPIKDLQQKEDMFNSIISSHGVTDRFKYIEDRNIWRKINV